MDWIREGGGIVVDDMQSTTVDYTIECHGQNSMPCDFSHSTVVSTQWIRSCFEVCFCNLGLVSHFCLSGKLHSSSYI